MVQTPYWNTAVNRQQSLQQYEYGACGGQGVPTTMVYCSDDVGMVPDHHQEVPVVDQDDQIDDAVYDDEDEVDDEDRDDGVEDSDGGPSGYDWSQTYVRLRRASAMMLVLLN